MRLKNAIYLAAAVLAVTGFFAVGAVRRTSLREPFTFRARFDDAGGLEPGAFVLLSGLKVGEVEELKIVEEAGRPRIEARASVDAAYRAYLRDGTPARIGSLGLVGEKHLALGFAPPDSPPLNEDGILQGTAPVDIPATLKRFEKTAANLESVTQTMADINRDLKEATAKLKDQWGRLSTALSEGTDALKFWRWLRREK